MITEGSVITELLGSCPGFRSAWQAHLESESAGIGPFIDAACFARYIVDAHNARNYGAVEQAFEAIERVILQGDDGARGVATVGILEDVQNIASHQPGGYRVFDRWLQPASAIAWNTIAAAWVGKSSLAEVIRDEQRPPGWRRK